MTTRLLKNPPKAFQLEPALRDYSVLRVRVNEVLILGRRCIEREFMLMRYHTGLLMNEHVRLNGDRASYGAQAALRLEKDFDIDHTELNRYAQFAKAYPIDGGRRQLEFNLPWTHYRKLMTIQNEELRYEVTAQAEKNEWSLEEIQARVRYAIGRDKDEKEPPRLPLVCLGPFYTYKIIRPEAVHSRAKELLLDLGFNHNLEMSLFSKRFPAETIITADEKGRMIKAENGNEGSLYTYKAYLERVLDGDTLKLEFQLGFGNRHREIIRLNGIDCPEMDTPEGKAAERFVEHELSECEFITVKSIRTRKEKWGRYLGDVFYTKKGKSVLIYLNQLLLDKDHAVRFRM